VKTIFTTENTERTEKYKNDIIRNVFRSGSQTLFGNEENEEKFVSPVTSEFVFESLSFFRFFRVFRGEKCLSPCHFQAYRHRQMIADAARA
jgi:hypothetical protein